MRTIAIFFYMAFILVAAQAQTNWALDKSHTGIKFAVTHMLISEVEGQFDDFEATVVSTTDDFVGAKVNFTAKVASINTGNERRDGHLKGDDFFDAENHPEITFDGKIVKEGDKYYLKGDFTMRGTTKEVTFDVKYNGSIDGRRGKKAGFKITGTVNRFDYGLKWDRTTEAGGLMVGEDVMITCNVELNEQVDE